MISNLLMNVDPHVTGEVSGPVPISQCSSESYELELLLSRNRQTLRVLSKNIGNLDVAKMA